MSTNIKKEKKNIQKLRVLSLFFDEPEEPLEYADLAPKLRKQYGYVSSYSIDAALDDLIQIGLLEKPRNRRAKGLYQLPQRRRRGLPKWKTAEYFILILDNFGNYDEYEEIKHAEKSLPDEEGLALFYRQAEDAVSTERMFRLQPMRKAKERILRHYCIMALFSLRGFHRMMFAEEKNNKRIASSAAMTLELVDKLRAILEIEKLPKIWKHHIKETVGYIIGDLNEYLTCLPEKESIELRALTYKEKERKRLRLTDQSFLEELESIRAYYAKK